MRTRYICTPLLLCPFLVLANTEIVNFAAEAIENPDIHFIHEWPVLDAQYSSLRWDLGSNPSNTTSEINGEPCRQLFNWSPSEESKSCLKELWMILDIDSSPDWEQYSKFTLRLSWPASHPVDAYLKVFSPTDIASLPRPGPPRRSRTRLQARSPPPTTHTRTKYARLQLLSTAVWTPSALESNHTSILDSVPLILTLEPLLFGVLPESVLPTVAFVALAAALGLFIARALVNYLEGVTSVTSALKSSKEE
ncbi:hypothetical protein BKA70DRAFT_54317 [Coprinopsis sp. MPI-PUGE-AT-0042]|nr:hypothetical protein BKA70DRAFT_54317 [Coprinopsis sp. MPI-PUGE-AT-0042]